MAVRPRTSRLQIKPGGRGRSRRSPAAGSAPRRVRLELRGRVQGVGFRPHVYRLAAAYGLGGFVANDVAGAVIEIEGSTERITQFERALLTTLPPLATIVGVERRRLRARRDGAFRIERSGRVEAVVGDVAPDVATCPACLRELRDPADRRHGYAFTNCTNCGPRYSIIRAVPYDRPSTTMADFPLCPACAHDYADPGDRRFHAEPIACPRCGPRLRLVDRRGVPLAGDPVVAAAGLLRAGEIVAIKGLGGFHLACRADDARAVARLRARKRRVAKPLAVMVADVAAAERLCRLSGVARAALLSPAAPIVLAPPRGPGAVASGVAPRCPRLGVMLPNTPLHHLLFDQGLGPLVMTSGNAAGEPLAFRDADARRELAAVADAFLVHDREIHRPLDDSVVIAARAHVLPVRRARGYTPDPIAVRGPAGPAILAVGADLKSAFCVLADGRAVVSEHLGDLDRPGAYRHYVGAVERMRQLFGWRVEVVAHDLHPAYVSTGWAREQRLPAVAVQHHHAHAASLMAEWNHSGPLIAVVCDGAGYGADGATWGGELLRCEEAGCERLGHLAYFPLIGGDLAAVQCWRPAVALLRLAYGADWAAVIAARWPRLWARLRAVCDPGRVERQIQRRLNCPPSSSLGRVFDGVAWLVGACDVNRHEAEAALALEALSEGGSGEAWPCEVGADGRWRIGGLVRAMVNDLQAGCAAGRIAARFHETLARMLARAAARGAAQAAVPVVGLSGGCFLNQRLHERVAALLRARGLRVLTHRRVSPGDGGIALGQAWVARWRLADGWSSAGERDVPGGARKDCRGA